MSVTVAAGTSNPIDLITDPDTGLRTKYRYPNIQETVTNLALMPEGLFDRLRDFINLWQHISDEPPTWISCPESEALEAALREHYKTGAMPDGWEFRMGDNPSERELVAENLDVPAAAPDVPADPKKKG